MKIILVIISLGILGSGCLTHERVPKQKTVRGYLKHFPDNARSSQAWHGHHFMIGNIPIIPTDTVPEAVLKKFVGTLGRVSGVWHPGERWIPAEKEMNMPMPVDPDKQVVIRGDGLKASMIR